MEQITDSKGNPVRTKKIYKRNCFFSTVFSLFTGIYFYFWTFEIDKETTALTKDKKGVWPCLVVFLSIITFGIYLFFWVYRIGRKQSDFYLKHGIRKLKLKFLYLFILLGGWALALICAITMEFVGKVAQPFVIINMFGIFFFAVGYIVVYCLMQSNVNKMLAIEGHDVYVRDSSIFNRPFWGSLILYIAASYFMSAGRQLVAPFFENNKLLDLAKAGTDMVNQMIKQSAAEVTNCNDISVWLPHLAEIAGAFVAVWWFAMLFRHYKYKGVLKFEGLGKALLLSLPTFIFVAFNVFNLAIDGNVNFQLGLIVLGFTPGVCEEVQFRGLLVPNFIRILNKRSGIYVALIVTSVLFGAVHIGNIFVGADVGTSFYQAFYAFALGMVFAAVLIRTGNLWAGIIVHGLIDTTAFMSSSALESGGIQTMEFVLNPTEIVFALICVGLVVYAFVLLRKSKHEQILELWRNKFDGAMLK